ncbi:hypothetical protein EB796_017616 [Bugula neritina]|uniref:Uncharacterized protein n=1 Tax=Bugula neritina TaxID=10212 RepID=A0A7J7JEP5_BUGNE|nr:hypothetical protein EB796_017616 [Bugula neritina]
MGICISAIIAMPGTLNNLHQPDDGGTEVVEFEEAHETAESIRSQWERMVEIYLRKYGLGNSATADVGTA